MLGIGPSACVLVGAPEIICLSVAPAPNARGSVEYDYQNLVVDACSFIHFHADRLSRLCRLNNLVLDLDRVDGLGEVRGVSDNVDPVADLELARQLDTRNSQAAPVVTHGPDEVPGHVRLLRWPTHQVLQPVSLTLHHNESARQVPGIGTSTLGSGDRHGHGRAQVASATRYFSYPSNFTIRNHPT